MLRCDFLPGSTSQRSAVLVRQCSPSHPASPPAAGWGSDLVMELAKCCASNSLHHWVRCYAGIYHIFKSCVRALFCTLFRSIFLHPDTSNPDSSVHKTGFQSSKIYYVWFCSRSHFIQRCKNTATVSQGVHLLKTSWLCLIKINPTLSSISIDWQEPRLFWYF